MSRDLISVSPQEAVPLPVIVKRIKAAIAQVPSGWVEAEINKVTPSKSGHFWLELAGGEDTLNAVIWRRDAERVIRSLPEPLTKGQKIHARFDRVDFYGPQGSLRIVVSNVRFVGEGELLRRRNESLERLKREGLCDKKRPLPQIPNCIGLIAGRQSEGEFDVLDAIRKRWPPAKIKFVPSLVQGARAPEQMVRSLLTLDADPEVDVIALCRGGGSVQDLLAFDDEELCRIIANIETPVVAAIGHTRNRPNAYYVADAEATVPQAAAELLVPAEADHLRLFDDANRAISREIAQAGNCESLLENLNKRLSRFLDVEPQRSHIQKLDVQLLASGVECLRSSADLLMSSQQAIENAWQRLPRRDSLDAPRARLLTAGERQMQNARKGLRRAELSIPVAIGKVPPSSIIDPQTARLARAMSGNIKEQRTEVDHLARTLLVGLDRFKRNLGLARQGVASEWERLGGANRRNLDRTRDRLDSRSQLLTGSARRVLQASRASVESRLRQIAALDPSARGFTLLRSRKGEIIDTVAALRSGQGIRLELHDGTAEGHIDHVIKLEKEET